MRNTGKALLGLAAAFAAGATIGVLYAPDKGDRTRRRLTRKGRLMYDDMQNAYEEGKDTLEDLRDTLKDNLERVNDEISRLKKCN
ncbi:MAG: hypothetical protein BGO70_03190 [Bacteroidetes bacterium 43-93]|jgi:gas vesicle protein|nr:YtxH domain-containing protein [Bacteroidota bacterium]OJW98905.1 MAG: hypothetical protein BGO70_03190 [Bacteroidetes bacterium 43-93]